MTVGNLTIQANVQGAPTGSRSINSVIPLNSAVDATQVITLSIGANTITVPTGATECIIYGPNSVNPTPNPDDSPAQKPQLALVQPPEPKPASAIPDCPHRAILELWRECLPTLRQPKP